jgi:predicted cupin superfamily sugar epimerase
VEHVALDPTSGRVRVTKLGPDLRRGHRPQVIVPGRVWQGARCAPRGRHGWSLVGCTMAPGWDGEEFVLAERAVLLGRFRRAGRLIRLLTR